MGVNERDPYTGHATTGHEWNGIKELNTAVPKAVWLFLAGTFLFSLGYWILMPAWPLGTTYSKGLLGDDVRQDVAAHLEAGAANRAAWTTRIDTEDMSTILADDELMRDVRQTGRALFGDNCAVCHGLRATGGPGFPDLVDTAWLWGGTPEAVLETIRVGINSEHPETRTSQMPAFGRDQMLEQPAILDAVAYVRSLSQPEVANGPQAERAKAGQQVFADNCSSCHGEDARGNTELGAPDLTDRFWIYGGDEASVYRTVYGGREGHMPTWEKRLSETDRKILTLYVLDLPKSAP
ncbi:cytochrome c oxidase cbb3-type subunit 3 [Pseudaminobacter salicylatoxidans]|uniref:Cbb3-type cytochrome c oxidase subunit n=1 Tax=Pseudaminobacter salicylatoxidans TaxID=93369 RepID=A0A316CNP7_PSESE|nr:cytochrome-c oxidase, cbb3-type subunit III [Pseudaminobacter salicylatoxidans]PWJ83774.1 cytochrome c oxidase cbb3-type subunit 3 [Pseudaminobacter salicylatoxidans]